jgi:hypothetical protein
MPGQDARRSGPNGTPGVAPSCNVASVNGFIEVARIHLRRGVQAGKESHWR